MPSPSFTYTLTNGTTADADQVMQNFNDILNGVSDGTKDLSISALTVAGTATFNGNVTLGNASSDDLTVTGSLASSLPIKTNNSYDIGSATLGLRKLYLGNGGAGSTCNIVAASHATTREYTIPDCSTAASFVMTAATQTVAGLKTFSTGAYILGRTDGSGSSSGYIGEFISVEVGTTTTSVTADTDVVVSGADLDLTAGTWLVGYNVMGSAYNAGGAAAAIWGRTRVATAAGTVVNASASIFGSSLVAAGAVVGFPSSRTFTVTITGSTTYRLRIACSVSAAAGTASIYNNSVTPGLSGDDNESVLWALRIA